MIISTTGKIELAISNGKYCITKSYEDNDITIENNLNKCNIGNNDENNNKELIKDFGIKLHFEEQVNLKLSEELEKIDKSKLKWTSSDSPIVSVSNNGLITGVSPGDAKVTVEALDGSNIKQIVDVKVLIFKATDNCLRDEDRKCTSGTLIPVRVNKTTTYNFYVINDTGSDLTLIMDRNLGDVIRWITKEDYKEGGGTNFRNGTLPNADIGPLTALKNLEERTRNWDNVPLMSYILKDDMGKNNEENIYPSFKVENVRARLLTYTEAKNVGCDGTAYCPKYLYDNVYGNKNPKGYWLSTAVGLSGNSYAIGFTSNTTAIITTTVDYISTSSGYGLRPVITISKDL